MTRRVLITVMRAEMTDDGFQSRRGSFAPAFQTYAERRDVSDGERMEAGKVDMKITTRFVAAWTARNKAISGEDILRIGSGAGAQHFAVTGVKMIGHRDRVEITCHDRTAPQ